MKRLLFIIMGLLVATSSWAACTDTTNYDLCKPASGDTGWATEINNNFDTIDGQMKTNADDIDTNDTATALNTTHRSSDGSDHSAVVTNSAKVTNATHTSEVTGSGALTIADDVIEAVNLESTNSATDNYVPSYDLASGGFTWVESAGGGGGTPGGNDTEVQFNDGGSFGGDTDFTYNKTTNVLTVGSVETTGTGQSVLNEGLVVNNDGGSTETHDFIVNTDTVSSALECDAGDNNCAFAVPIYIEERADAASDIGGYGQLWVNTATPNELWFTDDAGTDTQLGVGGSETNSLETTITGIADTEIFVGDGADSGAFVVMSVDATMANTGAVTVVDDSHAHTTTTLSGIVNADLSGTAGITNANLALTAGRSLTEATNDISADAELYTDTISFALETPADADAFLVWKAPMALTITDIDCITGAATSAVIDVQECTSAGATCVTVDAAITCDSDGAADDGTLSNGAIDAGDWINLDIGTVTGTVGYVSVTVKYTKDD